MSSLNQPGILSEEEKTNRELFVGNTPLGTSEQLLIQFFNGAMQRIELCTPDQSPIVNCRVNEKFAFVECASVEDANKALNLNGIPFMGTCLRVSRPSKYAGPHIPSKTWQELTGQPVPPNIHTSLVDDKVNRELFVGNTTPEMTEQALIDFLGGAMQQVALNARPGNPIIACRLCGKFAFVEFRSVAEAANALNLNNIPFMGIQLKVRRASKYTGPETESGNWEDILAKYMSGELKLPSDVMTDPLAASHAKPSNIVELKNMLSENDLKSDEDYEEILEDTKEECGQFGALKNVIIPRSGPGATKIFLEYNSIDDAAGAIRGLSGRTFDGRKVNATFMTEDDFRKVVAENN